jgi:hypothetical protein
MKAFIEKHKIWLLVVIFLIVVVAVAVSRADTTPPRSEVVEDIIIMEYLDNTDPC